MLSVEYPSRYLYPAKDVPGSHEPCGKACRCIYPACRQVHIPRRPYFRIHEADKRWVLGQLAPPHRPPVYHFSEPRQTSSERSTSDPIPCIYQEGACGQGRCIYPAKAAQQVRIPRRALLRRCVYPAKQEVRGGGGGAATNCVQGR